MNRQRMVFVGVALGLVVGAYVLGRTNTSSPPSSASIGAAERGGADSQVGEAPAKSPPAAKPPQRVAAVGAPLPLPGTPLKDMFYDLQARANAGDAGAASRLFRDLNRCSRLHGSAWKDVRAAEELTNTKTDGLSPAQLRTYQALLDAMEIRQRASTALQTQCAGVSEKMLDTLVPNIRQAAQLGDVDARACYLSSGPMYDARSLLDHPESLNEYRSAASSMIDSGLAAGDWRVVDLLRNAYEPGAQGLLAGVVGADAYLHYRYLKLYRLGAESHRSARLDDQLASAAADLTPAQVADADQWAQTTLQQKFGSEPSTAATPDGWDACAFAGN